MLAGFGRQYGLDPGLGLLLGRAFGSGMGQGGVCGALTGAFMVLGLALDRDGDEKRSRYRCYDLAEHLINGFKARHGTIRCRELLGGVDPATAAGRARAAEEKLALRLCPAYVDTAAGLLAELLADPPPSGPGSRGSELWGGQPGSTQEEE